MWHTESKTFDGETFDFEIYSQSNGPADILFVHHGSSRSTYRSGSESIADKEGLTVFSPVFLRSSYDTDEYQRGGIVDDNDRVLPEDEWTTRLEDPMVDWTRNEVGDDADVYLFGHSAGGQFLSRVAAYERPQDVSRIVIANPSTWVLPSLDEDAPYGFDGLGTDAEERQALKEYLALPMTIYLGSEDDDPGDSSLSTSSAAMRQGPNRLERGINTFEMGQEVADTNGWDFNWDLVIAEGVAHSGSSMLRAPEMADALRPIYLAANEVPYEITLIGSSVDENADGGTVIGDLSAKDPDGDELTFSVTGDPRFTVNGSDQLVVAAGADLMGHGDRNVNLTLSASDGRGGVVEADADVTIKDSVTPDSLQEPDQPVEQEPDQSEGSEGPDPVASTSFAVNAGGDLVNYDGTSWLADSFASDGKSFNTSASISGTNADAIYQSEKYGDLSYVFDIDDGDYAVTLKFAEIYFSAEGQRIFDVFAEGGNVIDDLDIYAEVGKNAAYDVTVPVSVRDGQLDLRFESEVDSAKISGIAITRNGDLPDNPEVQEPVENDGSEQPDSMAPTSLAVNAGGDLVIYDGTSWFADNFATGAKAFNTSAPISGTNADALYQTERYGDFSYAFDVENGDYEVTLKFAEIYFNGEGKRIFDVVAEGSKTIDDLDIYAEAGKNAAYDVTVPVSVRDGQLDLRFESEVDNAKISGIAITPKGADGPDTGEVADAPSNEVSAPFDLSGSSLEMGDAFIFGFGVDGKSAPVRQSSGQIGVDDAGSATEVDYRKGSAAGSEVIGFDFGEAGAEGVTLDLGGMSTVNDADEGAFFRTYDAAGATANEWLLTSNTPKTLEFSEAIRFATLESSPWITDGSWPSQEPDFSLQSFDIL